MQELIRIDYSPATIAANFEEIEARLQEYLRDYDVVVTADGVGDAKKLRTELRKQITDLDTRIKEVLKDASEPIRQADERRKELVKLGRDVDAKIKEQVDRFEDETREKARLLLHSEREKLWMDLNVNEDFHSAEFDDLVKLSAVTKKGSLTKAASDELGKRVRADKALQDRTERRLAGLASASYEAGLHAPLTRDHVQHFLFADDEKYTAELQRILDAEVERQKKAEQRVREQAEREAQQKAEAEAKEAERQRRMEEAAQAEAAAPPQKTEEPPPRIPGPDNQPEPQPATTPPNSAGQDKVAWCVVATFEVHVSPTVTRDAIKAEAQRVIEAAGITTLRNVSAQRSQQPAKGAA